MTRFVNCMACQTEGRIYTADGNNPDWTDHGVCPECNGERVVEVEDRPFYGAECPDYPNCKGGCGLGCTYEIEAKKAQNAAV
jgi:hypothetical protein